MLVNIAVPAIWENVEALRQWVQQGVGTLSRWPEIQDAVGMISAELLENAMKYGRRDQRSVVCRIRLDEQWASVEVDSTFGDDRNHLDSLLETVERLRKLESKDAIADAYMSRLMEVAGDDGPRRGLGLIRIAFEGGAKVGCRIDEVHRMLTVEAKMRTEP